MKTQNTKGISSSSKEKTSSVTKLSLKVSHWFSTISSSMTKMRNSNMKLNSQNTSDSRQSTTWTEWSMNCQSVPSWQGTTTMLTSVSSSTSTQSSLKITATSLWHWWMMLQMMAVTKCTESTLLFTTWVLKGLCTSKIKSGRQHWRTFMIWSWTIAVKIRLCSTSMQMMSWLERMCLKSSMQSIKEQMGVYCTQACTDTFRTYF